MNICQINDHDIANGPGVRVSMYVSGCTFKCLGCHNPEAQSFTYGEPFGINGEATVMNNLYKHYISGLSILGGEPLHPKNIEAVSDICSLVRMKFHFDKTIWIWTGYTAEELLKILEEYDTKPKWSVSEHAKHLRDVLSAIDVLVDGRYEEDKHSLQLTFRGSSNQRIIDAHKLLDKKIELINEYK